VPPGAVVVIDNDGRTDVTVWGHHDIAGTVINGVCRDVSASLSQNYPLFGRGRFMRTGKEQILKIRAAHGFAATYGSPRVWLELRRQGVRFARHDRAGADRAQSRPALPGRPLRAVDLSQRQGRPVHRAAVHPTPPRRRGRPSTGNTGDSFDNALAENLWSTLKVELLYWPGTTFATRTQAEHAVVRYIDGWYNPRRIQAGLGGLPPDEYDDR